MGTAAEAVAAPDDEILSALTWLGRVLRHLARVNPEAVGLLGSAVMSNCPTGDGRASSSSARTFRNWFVEFWNGEVSAAFRRLETDKYPGDEKGEEEGEDPLEFVLNSWPWEEDLPALRKKLRPLWPGEKWKEQEGKNQGERLKPEGAEDPLVSRNDNLTKDDL